MISYKSVSRVISQMSNGNKSDYGLMTSIVVGKVKSALTF